MDSYRNGSSGGYQQNQNRGSSSGGHNTDDLESKMDVLMRLVTDSQKENQRQFELRDKSSAAIEKQIGQLAADVASLKKNAGQLPSDTTVNPQHTGSSSRNEAHVNQVSIFHSGNFHDNRVGSSPQRVDGVVEEFDESVQRDDTTKVKDMGKICKPVPYPEALVEPSRAKMATKQGSQQEKMWEMFKQAKINIPFLDAIKKIPAHAKYLKDMCTQKRNLNLPKRIDLTENVSAILLGTLPPKLQDPGAPMITIEVGDFKMTRALLDLGASISILPGSLYDQYDFGPLRPTATTVVLADQTPKLPRGILQDVIVKVKDFYFPVDFLVLDYVPSERVKQPTVILGRPFLATADANISCKTGTVEMAFGNRKTKINAFKHLDNSLVDNECLTTNIIDKDIPLCDLVENVDDTTEKVFVVDRSQAEKEKQRKEEETRLQTAAAEDGIPETEKKKKSRKRKRKGKKPKIPDAVRELFAMFVQAWRKYDEKGIEAMRKEYKHPTRPP